MKEKTRTTGRCFSVIHFEFLDPEILKSSDVQFPFAYSYKFEAGLATISTSIGILPIQRYEAIGELGKISAELELAQAGDEPNTDPQHASGLVHYALSLTQKALVDRLKDTSLEGIEIPSIDRERIYNEILKDMGLPSNPSVKEIYGFKVSVADGHESLKQKVIEILRSYNPVSLNQSGSDLIVTYPLSPPHRLQDGPSAWNEVNALKESNSTNVYAIFMFDPWIEKTGDMPFPGNVRSKYRSRTTFGKNSDGSNILTVRED